MAPFGEEHVRKYIETGGAEGHDWQGTQTLIMTGHWPAYDDYQARTDRVIPVVVLEPASGAVT